MQKVNEFEWRNGMYLIPLHCHEGIINYIMKGDPIGGFLTAIVENDLMGAYSRADDINRNALGNYCTFLYNYAPANCHGSFDKRERWQASGGVTGRPCPRCEKPMGSGRICNCSSAKFR